jgi:hypothetical protein
MFSRSLASLLLILPAAAACTDEMVTTQDSARLISVNGTRVVVAASSETEQPSLGCGGGGDPLLGPSVLFVSDDSGASYERVVPEDVRPLTRIGVKGGVFYAIAQENSGDAFAILRSPDGRTWTQVAQKQGAGHDLSISASGLAVGHGTGVLTSVDGTTWTDNPISGGGFYAPSVAQVGSQLVVSSAADGVLHLRTGSTWTQKPVPGMTSIWTLIPTETALLVTGVRQVGGQSRFVIASVDLSGEVPTTFSEGQTTHAVVTPLGLLDTSGYLAPLQATGVGALTPFVPAFESATVEGNTVQLLRSGEVFVSADGGRTFGSPIALPIESYEHAVDDSSPR